MESWIPFLPLIGVIIGLVANPLINAAGYYFRRSHEKDDQTKAERKSNLVAMQDAIIDHIEAREHYNAISAVGATANQMEKHERELAMLRTRMETTERRTRQLAARIGDDPLWNMVNSILSNKSMQEEIQSLRMSPDYFGDHFDLWNGRIRQLFKEL